MHLILLPNDSIFRALSDDIYRIFSIPVLKNSFCVINQCNLRLWQRFSARYSEHLDHKFFINTAVIIRNLSEEFAYFNISLESQIQAATLLYQTFYFSILWYLDWNVQKLDASLPGFNFVASFLQIGRFLRFLLIIKSVNF